MAAGSKYIEAVIPESFTVCGVTLQPLTVGHWFYLDRFGLMPVDSKDKLITAIVLCSVPVEQVEAAINDRWLWLKLWVWNKRIGKIDWNEKLNLFSQYVAAHLRAPSVISKRDGNSFGATGTPFMYHVKVTLQAKLGYSHAAAWACPLGIALMDYYVAHECDGDLQVADRDFRLGMKKHADENAAEWIRQAQEARARN